MIILSDTEHDKPALIHETQKMSNRGELSQLDK